MASKKQHKEIAAVVPQIGKDEMNLAELPIARLGAKDSRETIEFTGQIVKDGVTIKQEWTVSANARYGLPTEFAERVMVALISIAAKQGFEAKTKFTTYEVFKLMGIPDSGDRYKAFRLALQRLAGVLITSQDSWWDHDDKSYWTSDEAFHLIDSFRLRRRKRDEHDQLVETGEGYVIWGDWLLKSFQAGYLKNLDTGFYYSLDGMLARRLYRFLDKRMHYQNRYELDIFALAARLGMTTYRFASKIKEKLQPAFAELIARGFLSSAEVVKVGKFTRVKFTKPGAFHGLQPSLWDGLPDAAPEDLPGDLPNPEVPQIDVAATGAALAPISAPIDVEPPQEPLVPVVEVCHSSEDLAAIWRVILGECESIMSYDTFRMIADSALLQVEDEAAVITVNGHSKDWIERQMRRKFQMQLSQSLGWRLKEISFIVGD